MNNGSDGNFSPLRAVTAAVFPCTRLSPEGDSKSSRVPAKLPWFGGLVRTSFQAASGASLPGKRGRSPLASCCAS